MYEVERDSVSVQATVLLCMQKNAAAWSRLWKIIESVSSSSIVRILRHRGFDTSLSMDVLQELSIYLLEDDMKRLSAFRGGTLAEFESYIRTIARRFAARRVAHWSRRQPLLSTNVRLSSIVDRNGANEYEVLTHLQEFEDSLSATDRSHLQALCSPNDDQPRRFCSERTLRRWKQQLRSCMDSS